MTMPIRLPANKELQESIAHLLKRPVGRPPKDVRRYHASFSYQARTWDKPRRVVAKVEWHPGELYPRVGFIVTNLGRPAERVVAVLQISSGTAEQWIKEGKKAIRCTRLSCRSFAHNAVRLQLHALARNLGNLMRTLALPDAVEQGSLTSLREKLIKIGAKIVRHGRYVTFQMAEIVIPRDLFGRHPAPVSTGSDRRQPRHERRHPVPSRRRRQDRCARDRRQKYHSAPPTPPIGPQSSGSARRWPSFEGKLHVARFRATLNGLGRFHMGNPDSKRTGSDAGGLLHDAGGHLEHTLSQGADLDPGAQHPAGRSITQDEHEPEHRCVRDQWEPAQEIPFAGGPYCRQVEPAFHPAQ